MVTRTSTGTGYGRSVTKWMLNQLYDVVAALAAVDVAHRTERERSVPEATVSDVSPGRGVDDLNGLPR